MPSAGKPTMTADRAVAVALAITVALTWAFVALSPGFAAVVARFVPADPATVRTAMALVYVTLAGCSVYLVLRRGLQEAEATRRGWQELASAIGDGLVLIEVGRTPRVLYVNRGLEAITGRSGVAFLADPYLPLEIVAAADRDRLAAVFADPEHSTWPLELTVIRPDGTPRRVQLTGSLVRHGRHRTVFQAMVVDITEQDARERALAGVADSERAAAQRLREVATMRDSFVASISHELRTPLTVITGAADTLQRQRHRLTPASRSALERAIVEQSDKLAALLDDVLRVGQIHEPADRDHRAPQQIADIGHLVDEVVARSPIADRVTTRITAPVLARADEQQLQRMVAELLTNAEKYAPGSPVLLSLNNGGPSWTLQVRDHGPGLSDQHMAHVLEPFYRADAEHPRPGLGLGLTLVAAVAAQHGGSVRIENDGGLLVSITAPCDAVRSAGRAASTDEVSVIHAPDTPTERCPGNTPDHGHLRPAKPERCPGETPDHGPGQSTAPDERPGSSAPRQQVDPRQRR